ncbi:TetR/AcrR family transcriptional regulator [Nocardia huaxiensis]|uniref:TetR/AcrR family transcriptional regulator n=1 Tax=Nocardia huaxiensis TaxID=2755382 RepID=A0A7D6VCI3_9NOCA|nr:TetR/AcrR family transcriptional regulator [Nocardia huaxiensis]QLY33161.1 TetR/AcrR family transcriptional regulator [Nocardia huaxiensis]UFS93065.1 TetR/AcrR family transcriptional regulator [Nocardia huaxiensis]
MTPPTEPAPPRRGRPPSADRTAQRRRELVATAYAVFIDKGYTAAGVNDITDRLGVATGTFYRYFDSKREILDHVIEFGIEKMFDAMQAAWGEGPDDTFDGYIAHLKAVGEAMMRALDEEPGMVRMLLFEGTAVDEELTARLLGVHEALGAAIASMLEDGVRQGYLREGIDTRLIGRSIYMMLSPSLVDMLTEPLGPQGRAHHIDVMLDLMLNGLRAPGSPQ